MNASIRRSSPAPIGRQWCSARRNRCMWHVSLHAARCTLHAAHRTSHAMLHAERRMLHVACYVACRTLHATRCMLHVACYVACCMLHVARCVLHGARRTHAPPIGRLDHEGSEQWAITLDNLDSVRDRAAQDEVRGYRLQLARSGADGLLPPADSSAVMPAITPTIVPHFVLHDSRVLHTECRLLHRGCPFLTYCAHCSESCRAAPHASASSRHRSHTLRHAPTWAHAERTAHRSAPAAGSLASARGLIAAAGRPCYRPRLQWAAVRRRLGTRTCPAHAHQPNGCRCFQTVPTRRVRRPTRAQRDVRAGRLLGDSRTVTTALVLAHSGMHSSSRPSKRTTCNAQHTPL